MMLSMLATDDTLPFVQQAMHDQFQKGGTYGSIVLTLAGLVGLVLMVYLLQRWYDSAHDGKDKPSHPAKLFRELLKRMNMPLQGQQLLTELTRDQEIKNPTALLISRQLFDQCTAAWQDGHTEKGDSVQVAKIRQRLFGGDLS